MSYGIPSSALEEHAVAERTILRFFCHFVVLDFIVYFKLKGEFIDGNLALTGIVLKRTCEEGLWEEEPRDPEGRRGSLVDPVHEEVNSVVEIDNP